MASKYDASLGDLTAKVSAAKKIVIVLPKSSDVDKIASSLSLMLALEKAGKDVDIVAEEPLKVSHANLFGVGEVKNNFPKVGGDNFVLTLEGVVDSNGIVSSLEKLDWYPENGNLNLVFHTAPGKKFEPTNIKQSSQGGKIDLVFVIGASSPADLGSIYTKSPEDTLVNIDNSDKNSNFGQINIVDSTSASISSMVGEVFEGIGLNLDMDIASNLMAGIYDVTSNLTVGVTPEIFTLLAKLAQSGGKISTQQPQSDTAAPAGFDLTSLNPPATTIQQPSDASYSAQQEAFTNPPVVNQSASAAFDETPSGEFATSRSPEGTEFSTSYTPPTPQANTEADTANPAPDWLTPKIYKGGGLG